MSKRKLTFRDFYYFILDADKKLYNCFIPDCPSHQWNLKVVEEQEKGRSMSALQVPLDKVEGSKQWYESQGYKYSEKLLVGEAYNNTREYTKKLPSYAQHADLNRVLIINCCFCGGKYGELNTTYPGMDKLHEAKPNVYTAICLNPNCGKEVDDNYKWYRDDKTNK